jgi:putative hydrolase of the HAD superfamily
MQHTPGASKPGEFLECLMLRFLVFDLDETLYPPRTGMFQEIGRRIHQWMQERLGFPPEEVRQVRQLYFERYGTTLRGLQIHYHVDANDYLAYVHDVDVSCYLRPAPALDAVLGSLPQEKVIFTNATAEYSRRVLQALGIDSHFQRIFDIYALGFHCKPDPEAYRILLEALPAEGPECLLVDDNLRNLRVGKVAGMHTLLVSAAAGREDGADWTVADVVQVGEVVRGLEN